MKVSEVNSSLVQSLERLEPTILAKLSNDEKTNLASAIIHRGVSIPDSDTTPANNLEEQQAKHLESLFIVKDKYFEDIRIDLMIFPEFRKQIEALVKDADFSKISQLERESYDNKDHIMVCFENTDPVLDYFSLHYNVEPLTQRINPEDRLGRPLISVSYSNPEKLIEFFSPYPDLQTLLKENIKQLADEHNGHISIDFCGKAASDIIQDFHLHFIEHHRGSL